MPYNGVGQFVSLGTPVYPAVPGEFILADYFNQTMNDIFLGLSSVLTRDGQNSLLANLPGNGFILRNIGAGIFDTDAIRYGQVFHGFTTDGPIKVPTLPATDNSTSVVNSAWVTTAVVNAGGTITYKGDWGTLVGAIAVPATVSYNGGYYMLAGAPGSVVADVTTIVPGASTSWIQLNPDASFFMSQFLA